MKLLHIDSSILGDHSVSRRVSAAIVAQLRKSRAGLDVTYLDLASAPLPHASAATLPSAHALAAMVPDTSSHASADAVLEGFLAADIVVIGVPMYNFTIPSQLKAWIDCIVINGKTFAYSAEGPRGLAGDKRVILALARGGAYGIDAPAAALEHAESYLRGVFGFIGVTPEIIIAEGVSLDKAKAVETALGQAILLEAA